MKRLDHAARIRRRPWPLPFYAVKVLASPVAWQDAKLGVCRYRLCVAHVFNHRSFLRAASFPSCLSYPYKTKNISRFWSDLFRLRQQRAVQPHCLSLPPSSASAQRERGGAQQCRHVRAVTVSSYNCSHGLDHDVDADAVSTSLLKPAWGPVTISTACQTPKGQPERRFFLMQWISYIACMMVWNL